MFSFNFIFYFIIYNSKLLQFSLYLEVFNNFINFYTILFILVKKNIIAKEIKFIVIKFIEILDLVFLFYLLINITFV